MQAFLLVFLIPVFLETRAFAFTTSSRSLTVGISIPFHGSALHLSGDDKEGDEPRQSKKMRDRLIPFFGRRTRSKLEGDASRGDVESPETTSQAGFVASKTQRPDKETVDPSETARILRAQAERARLEAERMDAELTLQKIEKLEKKLVKANLMEESADDLQLQLENLQAKLRGEAPKSQVVSERPKTDLHLDINPKLEVSMDGFLDKDFDETLALIEESPSFVKKLVATLVEYDFDCIEDLNSTEVARRVSMMNSGDFSYSHLPEPSFSQTQIDEAIAKIENKSSDQSYPRQFIQLADGNVTKLALYSLDYQYYISSRMESERDALGFITKAGEGEEWMQPLLEAINQTAVDRSIQTLYPKCMRREGVDEPTMAHVQSLVATVLPKARFSSTAKPEKVLGGYVIRGTHGYDTANQLIDAIDAELSKSNLEDKMTVLYSPDFTIFAQAEEEGFDLDLFDPDEQPPILYVTAPDIVGDRQRVLLSITSAMGLATSWYLSLYPFLLNPAVAKRVEDQLALADASMAYNLDWLTELSVPLFVSFLGIQIAHEVAHKAAAAAYGTQISFPTIVPSLITGTTSTVTRFKEPPKNKEAMFDFALAGPLAGIAASVFAITVGSQLTLTSDPASLPALPLEILRQSTLGGGIIDGIVKGALYLPDGAPMSGILISIHPLAIAGYISLVVNALSLLPIGTTDGGRIGLALFGRPLKLVVGNLFLFTLLLTGLLGSDLFLFYFAFVIAFQTGNEIPCRDETSDISFPRVIVAIVAYCIAFLSLVPFQ